MASRKDSIFVTNVPNLLLQDLKQSLMAHFDQFGTILRVSCVTKGVGKLCHLQFSTPEEAANAQRNGHMFGGLSLTIELTDKCPKTKILPARPIQPQIHTFFGNAPSSSKPNQATYLREASSLRPSSPIRGNESKPNAGNREHHLDESVREQGTEEFLDGLIGNPVSQKRPIDKEDKPNVCVKLELYKGPSVQKRESHFATSSSSTVSIQELPAESTVLRSFPRGPSFSQIMNLDTTNMKTIRTNNSSDALVCQFFGRDKHFPLAQMWSRHTVNMIMPVTIIMDDIKPGMKLHDESIEIAWKILMFDKHDGIFKRELEKSAEQILSQEKVLATVISPFYEKLEEAALTDALCILAEEAMNEEVDHWICIEDLLTDVVGRVCQKEESEERMMGLLCNEAVDDIMESVITNLIKEQCEQIVKVSKIIAKTASVSSSKLVKTVVRDMVKAEAKREFFNVLYMEIVDDFLESEYFTACVKETVDDLVNNAVESCSKALELEVVDNIVKEEARIGYLDGLCSNVVDDLLNSHYFELCVKVAVNDFLKTESFKSNNIFDKPTLTLHSMTQLEDETDQEDTQNESSTGFLGSLKRKAVTYLRWSWPFKKRRTD